MDVLSNVLNLQRLNNGELFSELAFYGFLDGVEHSKDILKLTTAAKIIHELYCRFTETDRIIEALREDVVQKVASYTLKNPNASADAQTKEIKRLVDDFTVKVTLIHEGIID